MNKKLEEYADERAAKWVDENFTGKAYNALDRAEHTISFQKGFETVINLDLAIKFTKWKDTNSSFMLGAYYKSKNPNSPLKTNKEYTIEELFQYWLNNVLTIKEL